MNTILTIIEAIVLLVLIGLPTLLIWSHSI